VAVRRIRQHRDRTNPSPPPLSPGYRMNATPHVACRDPTRKPKNGCWRQKGFICSPIRRHTRAQPGNGGRGGATCASGEIVIRARCRPHSTTCLPSIPHLYSRQGLGGTGSTPPVVVDIIVSLAINSLPVARPLQHMTA